MTRYRHWPEPATGWVTKTMKAKGWLKLCCLRQPAPQVPKQHHPIWQRPPERPTHLPAQQQLRHHWGHRGNQSHTSPNPSTENQLP